MEERMKRAIGVIIILFLLYLAGSFIHQAQAEGPKLLIPETVFDFGYAPPTSAISHYYLVKNVGTDTLKIEKVRPG
jgi:hypothetical protein